MYQVSAAGSITSPVAQEFPVGRQFLPVAGPLNDDLETGVGQAVQGAVTEDGVIEEAEPFLHGPIAGDDEAGDPVSVDGQLIEVGGLLSGEAAGPRSPKMSRSRYIDLSERRPSGVLPELESL